jgi:hypothetical protein
MRTGTTMNGHDTVMAASTESISVGVQNFLAVTAEARRAFEDGQFADPWHAIERLKKYEDKLKHYGRPRLKKNLLLFDLAHVLVVATDLPEPQMLNLARAICIAVFEVTE